MNPVLKLWEHADIAYEEPTGKEPLFTDCVSFESFTSELDFAYIAEYPKDIIISFRGTDSKDMNIRALKTWINNFDVYPLVNGQTHIKRWETIQEFLRSNRKGVSDAELINALHKAGWLTEGSWGKGTICQGFYYSFLKFKPWIDEWFTKFVQKKKPGAKKQELGSNMYKVVHTDGHSRGGTLAELCTRHLAKNCGIRNSCIEYGAPAAGTKDYRHEFRMLPCYATLVINGLDIVPDCPPEILGFRHGAFEETMPEPWYENLARPVYRIADHLPSSYKKRLPEFYG